MSSFLSFLSSLGLENSEPEVYIAALPLGTVAASTIATKLKLPRSSVRYTCEQLVSKGLMTVTMRANTKLFTAENPSKLYVLVHAEQERLERKTNQLADTVSGLQKLYSPFTSLPKVTFFEGLDGIERLLEEMIEEPTNMVSFGAGDYLLDRVPDVVTRFRRNAVRQYEDVKILRAPKYRDRHVDEKNPKQQTRYFYSLEELKIDIQIAEDKISLISVENAASIGVLIKHREMAEAFRQIFSEVWRNSEE